ncbi:MAG: amino acid ABC transporter permease [Treponema sp.]|jgi:polar amino acid transport system permease protein|nr:amino acid ABC transporter permease [Treponema sp.]
MPKLFDPVLIFTQIPQLLANLPVTLFIMALSILLGYAIGLLLALVKIKKIPVLRQLTALFVSFTRGTPILVQLYIAYYGIPLFLRYVNYFYHTNFNINGLPGMLFVIFAFSMNEAAYGSEMIRAAIESVDRGQIEAAQSLGMTYPQVLRRIVVPEAFVVALPSLGNSIISLLKGTSLAFVCAVVEMTAKGKILAGNSYRYFENYLALAIIYWVLTIGIEQLVKYAERRMAVDQPKEKPCLNLKN